MERKDIKFVTVNQLFHLGGASYEIEERFKKLVEMRLVPIEQIKLVTVKYTPSVNNVEHGPVRIYLANETAVYLNLPAGFGGSGPIDLCKVLELCEIDFDKNDILTSQEVVNLRYLKGAEICYCFKLPDGSVEYSM